MPVPDAHVELSTSSQPIRAWQSPRAWALLLTIVAMGLALDLGTKEWAFRGVFIDTANPNWMPPPQPPVELLPGGLLNSHRVVNRGAVFGIADNQRFFFIAFTLAALGAGLLVFGRMTRADQRVAHISLALILAGGIGNLHDRVRFGLVRDFLHMLPDLRLPFDWRWPSGSPEMFPWVFNVADVMLLVGMILLLGHLNRADKRRTSEAADDATLANAGVTIQPSSAGQHQLKSNRPA